MISNVRMENVGNVFLRTASTTSAKEAERVEPEPPIYEKPRLEKEDVPVERPRPPIEPYVERSIERCYA